MNVNQKSKIIGLLVEKCITQTRIAKEAEVSCSFVGEVIAGTKRSRKVETVITKYTSFEFPANKRVPFSELEKQRSIISA